MSNNVVYDLEYLKSKDFFKNQGDLKIDGKTVIWDKDNYLAYVEIENLEELEKIHNKLKKEYVKFEYFYYYIPKENKIKVFKRGCSVAFTYSDKIKREDVKKSKKDKLDKFSPENLNVLFDTKDVMDRFYNELWQLRLEMAKSIKKPIKDKDKLLVVQHFIDRLVFFYFLCQLGIVKVKYSIDGESYEYTMNKQTTKDFFDFLIGNLNDSELQKLLNSIFFEGLGNEHKVNSNGYVDVHVKVGEWEFDISVPYLNGGLFREKKITTENNTEIRESEIEFTGIKELIATLNKYNWVIGDYTDDEESVWNLTPEILGHVYEKFVVGLENIGEDVKLSELKYDRNGIKYGRKKIGAYYTPEEITSYISENTIISYLFDKLGLEKYNELLNPRVAFDEFVENASEEELKRALEVLNEIRVLDPACGSGHFLVSAGNLLFDLKECICNKLVEKFGFKRELNEYKEVKKIIVDNLYGVDISETAVEIAKLRLWLWLVSQLKDKEKIEPLPNLEYNIKCGNSLIGWVDEKLQPTLKWAYTDKIEGIFKGLIAFCGDEKEREILIKARELLKSVKGNILDNYVEAFHLLYEIYKTSHGHKATQLKEILGDVRNTIYDCVNPAFLNYVNSKLKEKNKISEKEFESLKPFHWRVDFGWIIKNGGFDVIIGNPPYINVKRGIDATYKKIINKLYKVAVGQYDTFSLFIEHSINLCKENGHIGMIVPKPLMVNENYTTVRKLMLDYHLKKLVYGSGIFFGANVENLIYILKKVPVSKNISNIVFWLKYNNGIFYNLSKTLQSNFSSLPNIPLLPTLTDINMDIITFLFNISDTYLLGSIVDVKRGVECGKKDSSITTKKTKFSLIRGEDVDKYLIKIPNPPLYINFDFNNKNKFKDISIYDGKKAILRRVSNKIIATLDVNGIITLNTLYNLKIKQSVCNVTLEYIVGVLNSKVMNYIFNILYLPDDKLFPYIRVSQIEILPIRITEQYIPSVTILVSYILMTKTKNVALSFRFEELLDYIIYELYFKEKFHEDGLYPELKEYLLEAVSKHLKPINYDRWAELYWKKQLENNLTPEEEKELKQLEEENLRIIEEVYEGIKDDKEINNLIKKIKSHEWVKIIEGG